KIHIDQYTGFTVEYKNWYKVVTNLINNEKYALVCCNQTLNDTSGYHAVVNTPLSSVSVTELSALPFFELLSLSDKVKAAQPSANVTSPCYGNITDGPQPGTSIEVVFSKVTASSSAGSSYIGFSSGDTIEINRYVVGMDLTNKNNETTVFSNINDFQSAVSSVDYIIDDTPLADFKGQNSFSAWLSAANYSLASSNNFIAGKNVYRTDGLINSNGYSDWPIRQSARADLVISDVIHMVYNTYEPDYSMTWLRAFAQLANSRMVSNATYPSCTDPLARLNTNQCSLSPFDPNRNSTNTTTESSQKESLSQGGKAGVAVGVIVGVAAASILGFFTWKKCSKAGTERTFYKMDDM
ncbi:hypothetical protein K501DRAFT_175424, partial [Backusella circina FSU 941]